MQAYKSLLVLAVAAALSACGGSSDNNNSTVTPPVAAALPAVVAGTVSNPTASSVTVNGYNVDTRNTTVSYAGQTLPASVLTEGTVVEVISRNNTVQQIKLDPSVAGTVTDSSSQQFTVAGQTFNYAATTLNSGDFVLVSTRLQADGSSAVSAVTVLQGSDIPLYFELEGYIQQLNSNQQSFTLNNDRVDYNAAKIEDGPLQNGQWVEVFGRYSSDVFQAVDVDVEDYRSTDGDMEIEGLITWVNAEKTAFELSGKMQFSISSTPRFDDGSVQDLVAGRYVEITVQQQNGQPVVTEIEFTGQRQPGQPDNTRPQKFSLTGVASYQASVFSINGFEFTLDNNTRYDDQLTMALLDGASLEIEGVVRNGQFIVREIERADNELDIDLEGQVTEGRLWGYRAADNSLQPFENQWADVDCWFDGVSLSQCKADD